jgi:hypothetical protein
MTTWLPRWFACLALALPFVPVAAAPDDAEIARLVKQLGHDDCDKREAASKRLESIGEPALAALRQAATESGDAEVRGRSAALLRVFQDRLDRTDCASVPAPTGAVVLFDGKGLEGWVQRDGRTGPTWNVLDGGVLEVSGGDIMTRRTFDGGFRLHVEFRVKEKPGATGQARSNSGVYLQGRYEIQILDSYGLACDRQSCAAVYGLAAPTANACKAPGVWQSFDIEFHAPEYADGRKTADVCVTVVHNGVKVHDGARVAGPTSAALPGDPSAPGPILLQGHGDPVQFRNVWLSSLPKR